LSFGAVKDVAQLLRTSVEHDVLSIDLCDVPFIDSGASIALEEVIIEMHADGRRIILGSLRESVRNTLENIGLLAIIESRAIISGSTQCPQQCRRTFA